jgi:hypothetical protein
VGCNRAAKVVSTVRRGEPGLVGTARLNLAGQITASNIDVVKGLTMIRMNRNVGVALVVAALAAAGIGVAVKAAEDHTTTYTFNYTGVKITNNSASINGATMTGSTNVPNVGPVDLTGRFFTNEGVHGNGTLTVRKNKADKIFFTFSKGEIDSTGEFECTMTLTGGTGTYENCEGTGLVEGQVNVKNKKTTIDFLAQGVISF